MERGDGIDLAEIAGAVAGVQLGTLNRKARFNGADGMGLFDSLFTDHSTNARLARIERKLDLIIRQLGISEAGDPAMAEVVSLARDPKSRIKAVKRYREITGAGLADAVDAVDELAK